MRAKHNYEVALWDVDNDENVFGFGFKLNQIKSNHFYWSTQQKRLLETARLGGGGSGKGHLGMSFFTWVDVC